MKNETVVTDRYLVFFGDLYYPNRWDDFKRSFGVFDNAKSFADGLVFGDSLKWAEVVDLNGHVVVYQTQGS